MLKIHCLRAVNSLEFIGIAVLLAVVLTSLTFSAQADRDPHVRQKSLSYSHLVNVQQPQRHIQQ